MGIPKVIIAVHGGIPEAIYQPDGIEVVVHDYDLEAYLPCSKEEEKKHIYMDKDGNRYWRKTI